MDKSKNIKKHISKKHHYLPRYYLKGFTDINNLFFVYDKKEDRVFPNALTPDSIFFENNLNTIMLPNGNYSDFLEDLYAEIENQSWTSLNNIRNSDNKTPIELMDKMHLFSFLLFLHWRLPKNIVYVEELSKKFFNLRYKKFNYFTIKSKSGEVAPKEVLDKIKDSSAFKKSSKLMIPFAPFYSNNWAEILDNWRFLFTGDGQLWNFVGDNPIITKGDKDNDPISCLDEFIFPVSGKVILINTNKPVNRDLPPKFTGQFNTTIIEKAQRFVACHNRPFLEAIIKYYKIYLKYNKRDKIISELFEMIEN